MRHLRQEELEQLCELARVNEFTDVLDFIGHLDRMRRRHPNWSSEFLVRLYDRMPRCIICEKLIDVGKERRIYRYGDKLVSRIEGELLIAMRGGEGDCAHVCPSCWHPNLEQYTD